MSNFPQMSRASAFGRWLRRRAENVDGRCCSAVMFATFIIQIFARYVLNNPVGWSEEVIITAWLWTVLWGAAFVVSEAEEIRFDIIYSTRLGARAARPHGHHRHRAGCALRHLAARVLCSYVSFMKVERSAYLHVPINWLYSIYVIFRVACICRYCWLVVDAIRGGTPPDTDAARLTRLAMPVSPFALCIIAIVALGALGLPIGHSMIVRLDPLPAARRASISARPPSRS